VYVLYCDMVWTVICSSVAVILSMLVGSLRTQGQEVVAQRHRDQNKLIC